MHDASPEMLSLFDAAIERPSPAERAAFLDAACGANVELRQRIEALLRAHEEAGGFLQDRPTVVQPATESLGSMIGPYKLLEQIGEGGFGVVFMAEQTQPVRRKVALKILKPGMDTRQVVARFEAERQALAIMDHPNIAKVFDGGATPAADAGGSQRPYFVMELVKGIPITEYCDQGQLTPRERLELFVSVCQAVQHAHQKGLIHRDIKPTNVLVTLQDGAALVKVIDFGIAKARGQQLTDKTLFTGFAQMIGTPLYMSPEQAALSNVDVDTRSDIYSLGVLLYELLTGTTPFDRDRFREVGYDEMRRIIREEEPPRPSTRIRKDEGGRMKDETKRTQRTRLDWLRPLSSFIPHPSSFQELDWIVMKALEKDRNRRYETASAFAADVKRYLHDEPVQARPATATYRLRKFARRHKGAALVAGFVMVTLLAGIVMTTLGLVEARSQRDAADQARENEARERAVAEDNARLALKSANHLFLRWVEERLPRDPVLERRDREWMERGLGFYAEIGEVNSKDPAVRLEVGRAYHAVGAIQDTLGRHAKAEKAYRRAVDTIEELARDSSDLPKYRHERSKVHYHLGILLRVQGRWANADEHYREALRLMSQLADESPGMPVYKHNQSAVYNDRARLLEARGDWAGAEKLYRLSLDMLVELANRFPEWTDYRENLATVHNTLGSLLMQIGKLEEAGQHYRAALDFREQLVKDFADDWTSWLGLSNSHTSLGELLALKGDRAGAVEKYQRSLEFLNRLAGEFRAMPVFRAQLAHVHLRLGKLWTEGGRYEEAARADRIALDLLTVLTSEHPAVWKYQGYLGECHHDLGRALEHLQRTGEAEGHYRLAIDLLTKLADKDPIPINRSELGLARANYGLLLLDLGRHEAAIQQSQIAYEIQSELVKQYPAAARHRRDLAACANNLGYIKGPRAPEEAEKYLRQALDLETKLTTDQPKVPEYRALLGASHLTYGEVLYRRGAPDEAADHFRRAVDLFKVLVQESDSGPHYRHPLALAHTALAAKVTHADGRESEKHFLRAHELWTTLAKEFPREPLYRQWLAKVSNDLGSRRSKAGDRNGAATYYRQAIDLGTALVGHYPQRAEPHWLLAIALSNLWLLDMAPEEREKARDLLEKAVVHLKTAVRCDPESPTYHESLRKVAPWLAGLLRKQANRVAAAEELGDEAKRELWHLSLRLGELIALSPHPALIQSTLQGTERVAGRYPQSWYGLNAHGVGLFRAGRFDEAIAKLEEARKLREDGGNAFDWLYLALAHGQLGHKEEAVACLQKADEWIARAARDKAKDAHIDITPNGRDLPALEALRQEADLRLKGIPTSPKEQAPSPTEK
jgi:serine/threonine protein kinase/Flp pilus assembly protein TadD